MNRAASDGAKPPGLVTEWLEPDGLGGFASGTAALIRTRRYHGLLLAAQTPPTGRMMLVNGLEACVDTPAGRFALSSHRYLPDVVHPDGVYRIEAFTNNPWPRWTFRVDPGLAIEQELFVVNGGPLVAVCWRARGAADGVRLSVRPLISGRDYHATHHENGAFRFDAHVADDHVTWTPYDGLPAITAIANGGYINAPEWYRSFLYEEEQRRGLDAAEDLASPGVFTWDLSRPAVLMLTTRPETVAGPAETLFEDLRAREKARRVFATPFHRAADAYLVQRGSGRTLVAGYPWFTDWGRDTFIALRGLCIATGGLAEARDILLAWAGVVSNGMLPNRFPDRGDVPEFNSVDASLWYVIAVADFLDTCARDSVTLPEHEMQALQRAVESIVEGYAAGTRYGIRMDVDGLLACGEAGVQLTWMDAKIGEWVVTPRTGKPVEIQALWINALAIAARWTGKWSVICRRARASFRRRFWNPAERFLYDVADVDHESGRMDATFRPNQIFAVGGLPLMLLDRVTGRAVVDAVESRLLTPMGLRSLAPDAPGYAGRYEGSPNERDARYHQGTVWPWLLGPFVEAWLRVHGATARNRRAAHERFLQPLIEIAEQAGGHLPEIADGDPPHTPRGCPAQAWSVGEMLRAVELTRTPQRSGSQVAVVSGQPLIANCQIADC